MLQFRTMAIANKKQTASWCLFDFANSSYSTVIASVIFPVYYATQIVGNHDNAGDLWWGRAVSLSMAMVAATSPFIGGIADYGGIRKKLLLVYTLLCVSMVGGFSFLQKGMIIEGFFMIVLANIGMEGGLVFYNSFLNDVAEKEYRGRVSAWGFAAGYAGSIISLVIALLLIKKGLFNWTWLSVSVFFLVFTIPAFVFLPSDRKEGRKTRDAAAAGLRYTWNTFKEIWSQRETRKFLIAYLFYEDGVNTVIVFSGIFAATTLNFRTEELIGLYLLVQATALLGAFVMARPVDSWGPKKVVISSLLLWTTVSVAAFLVQSKEQFWFIACIAGLGLGTVQAASRAFFAQEVPKGRETEYFGVYSMVGKSSAVAGPFLFGYMSSAFGSQRPAILSVALFFLTGLVLVSFVKGGGPNLKASA